MTFAASHLDLAHIVVIGQVIEFCVVDLTSHLVADEGDESSLAADDRLRQVAQIMH